MPNLTSALSGLLKPSGAKKSDKKIHMAEPGLKTSLKKARG